MGIKRIVLLFSVLSVFKVNAQQSDSPKLMVGIVIDQMCYEYLYRYYERYSEGGFKKLMNNGTNCRNTNYNYVPTYTGPGHATIYTGTTPNNHGIVANDWYDRKSETVINCVGDSEASSVGTISENGKASPQNLKVLTITDQLKLTYKDAKVISMSIKDRGAILPGGHLSDGSYWYDYSTGKFITSNFFKKDLPNWVEKFNKKGFVDEYLNQTWNTLYDIKTYTASGPDDSPYEHLLSGKTSPTFPYDLKQMCATEGVHKYGLFPYTPFSNTLLTDFALKALEAEELGKDNQTDMLCISYSTPDLAGHAFGPYSVEIEDMYLRLDLEIARLITKLEEKLGKDGFTLFLTADHAVVPVPQELIDNKLPGGYFFVEEIIEELREKVDKKFDHDVIASTNNLNIYLDHEKMDDEKISRKKVSNYIADYLRELDEVKWVYTYEELQEDGHIDEWKEMIRRGYHKEESGDVIVMLESGYLAKLADSDIARKGTSHGSAYAYDTHVPLLWYGKHIPTQEVLRHVSITDISATLTHLLYLQKPSAVTGEPIIEIFGQ